MDEETYKSVLIANDSADAHITLYLYYNWDVICWLSFESKIIKPSERYLHRSKEGYQFKLVAKFEDKRQKKELLGLRKWDEDKLFKITGPGETDSPSVIEEKLANFPQEKQICLRKVQRDKELKSTCGKRNLYDILGIDMDKVRKMSKEEQSEAIKKGWRTQLLIWHPDHNGGGGDGEIAKEIIFAYQILQDEERRAHYNITADYDRGWLSLKRYKAIFWPKCVNEEQKRAYRKRMGLFALSALLTIGGVCSTVLTAGLAAPALVATGAVFGGGFLGAGLQSLQHTVNKISVVDGCHVKDWLMKAGIGFIGGAVTGGAGAGITSAVTGLGSAALESAAVTAGQYIGIGAATGATGGVASSLASDAGRKFVDGDNITWKQAAGHALCGSVIGAVAGVAGGAVTKGVVGSNTSAAAATLEVDVGEQLVVLTGARRLGKTLARNIPRMLTENGTESVMGSVSQFAEERLDDSVENQSPGEHVVNGVKYVLESAVKGLAKECGGAVASHACNEIEVHRRYKKNLKNPSIDSVADQSEKQNVSRHKVRFDLSEENNEHLHNWRNGKCSATYQPLYNEEPSISSPPNLKTIFEENERKRLYAYQHVQDGKIKYISEGAWISKMVVKCLLNDEVITQEVSGSGEFIDIPFNAKDIEVRFKVRRPFWGDIFKYDRFRRCWCEPDQPHVFRYDTPPIRTFTISGNLWREAVMTVSDKYHEETNEL